MSYFPARVGLRSKMVVALFLLGFWLSGGLALAEPSPVRTATVQVSGLAPGLASGLPLSSPRTLAAPVPGSSSRGAVLGLDEPRGITEVAGLTRPPSGARSPREVPTGSSRFWRWVVIFLMACGIATALLVLVTVWILYRAKKLVEGALKPDIGKLEKRLARLRAVHPDLDRTGLARKISRQQARRAGAVGFFTGLGGFPFLPLTLPIDVALTVRCQSELVHTQRLLFGAQEVPETGLWIATAGGQELTSATLAAVRKLLLEQVSKNLLKFLPLVGGVVGFLLNWLSTRALGRMSRRFFEDKGRADVG